MQHKVLIDPVQVERLLSLFWRMTPENRECFITFGNRLANASDYERQELKEVQILQIG